MRQIMSVESLEAAVGGRPSTALLKSIAHLDEHCAALLRLSPLSVVTVLADTGPTSHVAGGAPGLVHPEGPNRLVLEGVEDRDGLTDGAPAGLLALVPGYGETLRVNGRMWVDGTTVALEVEEAFLHCAKAVIRSRLWDPFDAASDDGVALDPVTALRRSPFVTLGTVDGGGRGDVSPKGDPAGFVVRLDDTTIAIPDRPGNRRTDTLHNLLDRPDLSLVAFVPGREEVLEVQGSARITDDPSVLGQLVVAGKQPKVAIVVDVHDEAVRTVPAIGAAHLWDTGHHADPGELPRACQVWVDHVRLNDDPGLAAKAVRRLVSPRVLRAAIDRDYQHNLY